MISIPIISIDSDVKTIDQTEKITTKPSDSIKKTDDKKTEEKVNVFMSKDKKVSTVDLSEYLLGVCLTEMDESYPDEAIKAQAVAAHTLYLYRKAENLKNHLNDEFGEYITAYRNKYFVDVVFKGCSKATGIEKVCKNFNLADNNVYVIGDSWNDLSMFERYDNSYTFTYSEKTLQKKANKVIDSFHYCIDDILS